jgi:hypothetical protein
MEQESGSTKKSTPTEQIVETVYVKGMLESLKIQYYFADHRDNVKMLFWP